MTAPWKGSKCDKCGFVAGFDIVMAPNGWQYCRACADAPQSTPTRDAEQAVREARSLFNQECQSADTVYDADVQDRLDALITAVRQAERAKCAADYLQKMSEDPESAVAAEMARAEERARIRGIVEGMPMHSFRPTSGAELLTRDQVLAALSSEGT